MLSSLRVTGFLIIIFNLWIGDRFTTEAAVDYCAISSCESKSHTMCMFPDNESSSECNNYTPVPLTNKEILALVKKHNELRKKVADGKERRGSPGPQPPASNMKEMKWDAELARIAQRWADQCTFEHDECNDVERFQVGQNVANVKSPTDMPIEDLVNEWYDEVELFNKNYVAKYRGGDYGHYSQLVWADSSRVGCGRAKFFDQTDEMNTLSLVCNYGPSANFKNEPVYKKGKTASACPSDVSSKIPSLCE